MTDKDIHDQVYDGVEQALKVEGLEEWLKQLTQLSITEGAVGVKVVDTKTGKRFTIIPHRDNKEIGE